MSTNQAITKLIGANPVLLVTKSWCSFCKRAIANVESQGVKPKILELDTNAEGSTIQQELTNMTRQSTVPYIFINGKFIGGYSDFVKTPFSKELKSLI